MWASGARMKYVAMIPARLGSTRVPRKNLRFLGDKPLLAWTVETVRNSDLFDEVYVNSESLEIGALAKSLNVKFYHRDEALATNTATSEHFIPSFLKDVACDVLFQVTPTSPFITSDDLYCAKKLIKDGANTVLSVRRMYAEAFIQGTAINFDAFKPMLPSQSLCPIDVMCNGIFAWKDFTTTYGYNQNSYVATLLLEGDSALDIDTEEDFTLAEAILEKHRSQAVPRYWSTTEHAESSAEEVLEHDGVYYVDMKPDSVVNLENLLETLPITGGAKRVVQRSSNCATVISQLPGEGNRRHYHPDWDEWWLILEGHYEYEIEGRKIEAKKGDLISIGRGSWHQIKAIGNGRATRLAVSRDKVVHVYHD